MEIDSFLETKKRSVDVIRKNNFNTEKACVSPDRKLGNYINAAPTVFMQMHKPIQEDSKF